MAHVTGLVNQELLLQKNTWPPRTQILRGRLPTRLRLTDPQRSTLAEIGKRLGRQTLAEVAVVGKPAQKFDGSKSRSYPGRPAVTEEVVQRVVRMARENKGWGYDRISGALVDLGHRISDQTVGNILRRHGIAPAPKRSRATT